MGCTTYPSTIYWSATFKRDGVSIGSVSGSAEIKYSDEEKWVRIYPGNGKNYGTSVTVSAYAVADGYQNSNTTTKTYVYTDYDN